MTAADRPSVPRVGDTLTTAEQLDTLWHHERVLIEASGTYSYSQRGTFTKCWARPVPEFVGGERGTWEVLAFGSELPHSLTTSDRIVSATVLHVPGEPSRPSVTDNARAEEQVRYPDRDERRLSIGADPGASTRRAAFVAGAEWAAGRAETTTEVTGSTSDGHHTFDELYEYRLLYNAHAARGWHVAGIPVAKSWRHSDGEPCFGGGWFIVTATLPTGQVSNHYKADAWDLFQVPDVDLPPEYDGHTPAVAAERLRAALAAGRAETTTATTEDEVQRAIEVMTEVHLSQGSITDHEATLLARGLAAAGLLATARTHPTREQVITTLREHDPDNHGGWHHPADHYYEAQADAVLALLEGGGDQ